MFFQDHLLRQPTTRSLGLFLTQKPADLMSKLLCGFRRLALPNVVVGRGGLEPPTSRLSSARSNRLSYQPEVFLNLRFFCKTHAAQPATSFLGSQSAVTRRKANMLSAGPLSLREEAVVGAQTSRLF